MSWSYKVGNTSESKDNEIMAWHAFNMDNPDTVCIWVKEEADTRGVSVSIPLSVAHGLAEFLYDIPEARDSVKTD